jgi:hypothetical protein
MNRQQKVDPKIDKEIMGDKNQTEKYRKEE